MQSILHTLEPPWTTASQREDSSLRKKRGKLINDSESHEEWKKNERAVLKNKESIQNLLRNASTPKTFVYEAV